MKVLKPDIKELDRILTAESEHNGGSLPALIRFAWDSYLYGIAHEVIDHVDYDELRHHFPELEDDPVGDMAVGKHYLDHDPNIPEGEFVEETEFESLSWKIEQDAKHLGGKLTTPFAVAWYGKLLGLHQCDVISDAEYEQLLGMLPALEDNPVKRVEEFTRRYATEIPRE